MLDSSSNADMGVVWFRAYSSASLATMSKLFRFQTDIQPSLMFIQRAQKKFIC
jgi:hypothetical protein